MRELPLEPSEYPGTPEYEELREERKRRALQRRWYAVEDDLDRLHCYHA